MIKHLPIWVLKSRPFQAFLYHVVYRYRCPYPIKHDWARDCVRSGECGCNNQSRY